MTDCPNFPLLALEALERDPGGVAISTLDHNLGNAALAGYVRAFARQLALRQIGPGACVGIGMPNDVTAFVAALATNLLGAHWVRAQPGYPADALGVTHELYVRGFPQPAPGPQLHLVDPGWLTQPTETWQVPLPGLRHPDSIVFIGTSSGTTGRPKYVYRTLWQSTSVPRHLPEGRLRAFAELFPFTSSVGYRDIARMLGDGVPVVVPPSGRDCTGMFGNMARAGVDFVMGSPAQLEKLIFGHERPERRIRMLAVGGSVMTRESLERWLGYFDEILLIFGNREGAGGGRMHVRSAADLDDIAYTLREGIEAQILSETGEILPHSTPGILRLRSPTMATSYIGNPEATAAVFRDGWFYSGDLGSLTEDGRLRILGRTIDTFNFGGIKVNAADIDASVLRVPGVRSAMSFVQRRADGVVALSVCAVAEPAVDRVALAAAIRGSVQAFHRTLSVQRVVFADDLPLNDNGKPVRAWGGELAAGLAVY